MANIEDPEKAAADLVYRSCLLMDQKKFEEYFELCSDDFHYTITAFSPEARVDMIWMDEDKASLKRTLDVLPRHNSDHSPLSRHVTVYTVDYDPAQKRAQVVSALQVFKTSLDGGETKLFAVAKYYDMIALSGTKARLIERIVRLETRMLGLGSHIPL